MNRSERMAALWKNPEFRNKQKEAVRKFWNDPESRARRTEVSRQSAQPQSQQAIDKNLAETGLPAATSFDKDGYLKIEIRLPNGRKRYVRAHRWVMEQHLGRPLLPSEVVHHKCGDKACYNLEHLEILTPAEHNVHHHKGKIASDEAKQRMSAAGSRRWTREGEREKQREHQRQVWNDPEYRAAQTAERRSRSEKVSAQMKKLWQDRKQSP